MKLIVAYLILCVFFISGCRSEAEKSDSIAPGIKLSLLGTIKNRTTHEIESSNWSVGGETMDRDFTVYNNWKSYVEPLGIKRMRIQSGWAKTEKEKGVYDWGWLDEVIYDLKKKSVQPWVCLCYGNPIYKDGGTPLADSPLPSAGEALSAWKLFIQAFVERYKDQINEWEIWNEPNLHEKTILRKEYAEFFMTTAQVIRKIQPDAHIMALSILQPDTSYAREILNYVKDAGMIDLINEVTYHPYSYNPDEGYNKVIELRKLISGYNPDITIFQGENGAPSERRETRAIGNYDWTETSQAKWALRRMIADFGHNIPSSYFSIMDMKYPEEINRKGLLHGNDDKTIDHPKIAYYAIQNLAAVFDDNSNPITDFQYTCSSERKTSVYGFYNSKKNINIISAWFSDQIPDSLLNTTSVDFNFPGIVFSKPVLVDLLSGNIYRIPKRSISKTKKETITNIPIYDSPCLITEEGILRDFYLIK